MDQYAMGTRGEVPAAIAVIITLTHPATDGEADLLELKNPMSNFYGTRSVYPRWTIGLLRRPLPDPVSVMLVGEIFRQ